MTLLWSHSFEILACTRYVNINMLCNTFLQEHIYRLIFLRMLMKKEFQLWLPNYFD